MKSRNIARLFTMASFSALTGLFWIAGCGGETHTTGGILILTACKTSVEAGDPVSFTVTLDGTDVTSSSEIKNTDTSQTVNGGIFSSDTAGKYSFVATYQGHESNTETITVSQAVSIDIPVLIAEPDIIVSNRFTQTTFTVILNGEDVTSDPGTRILNRTADQFLEASDGIYSFSSEEPGRLEFAAICNEIKSKPIYIEVKPYSFYKNVAFIKFTNTGCGPCTEWTLGYWDVKETIEERLVEIVAHVNWPSKSDPYLFDDFDAYMRFFGVRSDGVPTGTLDMRRAFPYYGSQFIEEVNSILEQHPAGTGFTSNCTVTNNNLTVKAEITIKATRPGRYCLVVALLEDHIGAQILYGNDFPHDNTLFSLLTPISGDDLGEMGYETTVTKTYDFDVPKSLDYEAARLAVYTMYAEDNEWLIDNAAYLSLDSKTPYVYEDYR